MSDRNPGSFRQPTMSAKSRLKARTSSRAARQTSVRLLDTRLRVDIRRELGLEFLDSAGAPAVGQVDRHRVGEDLLITTLDAVEDRLRDRLRSRLRYLEAAHHVRGDRPGPTV